jgi:hypothetical protein
MEKIEERKRLSWKLGRMAERSRNTMAGRVWEAAQLETESDDRKVEEYDGRKGRGSGSVGS